MTYLNITLETKEIQSLIDKSVEDDSSKTILTTVFNQLMEEQRTQYIQAEEYERSDERKRNRYYERAWDKAYWDLKLIGSSHTRWQVFTKCI